MLRATLRWFDLTITALGLVGNAVSIAILCQAALRSSTSVLLLSMAVYDSLYLVANLVMPIDGVPYFSVDVNVDAIFTAEYIFVFCSVYTVVTVTLERYVAVSHPFHARRFCTIRNTCICLSVIFIMAIVFCVPRELYMFTFHDGNRSRSVNCYTKEHSNVYCNILPSIVILIIPFPAIMIFNLLIIRALVKRRKTVRRLSSDSNEIGEHLTRTTVGITMCYFFFCVFPGIYYVGLGVTKPDEDFRKTMSDFANSLIVLNCSTNFILYCLLGKRFRQVLMDKFIKLRNKHASTGSSCIDNSVFENVHLKGVNPLDSSHV